MKEKEWGVLMVALVREDIQVYKAELLDLRNDFVFKAFFGDKRNEKLLIQFLNAILEINIRSLQIMNPQIEVQHVSDKSSVMDILCKTDKGELINIEMQLQEHRAFPERMLMYWAKMYASQDEKGKSYRELKKAIQIIISDFNFLSKNHFHSMFQLRDEENGAVYSDHIEVHVLELPKLQIQSVQNLNDLEKWVLFLKGDQKTKEALAMESSAMKEAFDEIERLSQNPETRYVALSREKFLKDQLQREEDARDEGIELGEEKGIKKGRKDGIAEGKREIVLYMYHQKTPKEMIAKLTNISIEKIEEIIQSESH